MSVRQNPCYRKIGKENNSVRSCQGVWNFTVPSVAHLEDEAKVLSAHQGNINPSRKRARDSTHADVEEALLLGSSKLKVDELLSVAPCCLKKLKIWES